MELLSIAAVLLGFLALLLGAGVWIAVALMATGWAGMQFAGGGIPAGSVLATTVWGNSASWSLAALPLFIWMGEILFRTRLSEEMFRGFAPWLNWLPGRLMHVNVLACGVFGSVSGSSAATCATVAKIALPELKKRGYDEDLSLGSLAGAGTLGILIPPSITMVGLRRAGERLHHSGVPRRISAGPVGDGALFRLHRNLVARQSETHTAGRTADEPSQAHFRVA
jgi:TRAP-type mannitol/chloroaromatic compound transport system permease large subunit